MLEMNVGERASNKRRQIYVGARGEDSKGWGGRGKTSAKGRFLDCARECRGAGVRNVGLTG